MKGNSTMSRITIISESDYRTMVVGQNADGSSKLITNGVAMDRIWNSAREAYRLDFVPDDNKYYLVKYLGFERNDFIDDSNGEDLLVYDFGKKKWWHFD